MQKRCSHNNFTLKANNQLQIHISSDFDSGNLQAANLISVNDSNTQQIKVVKIQFIPANDPFNSHYSTKQSQKSFFHFSVKSNKNIIIHGHIRKMNILSIIEDSFQDYYRICIGKKKSAYQPPEYNKQKLNFIQLTKNWQQYTLQFKYQLIQNQKTYFAYHFPYSYEKMCHFLQDLDEQFKHSKEHNQNPKFITGVRGVGIGEHNDIYYKNQLLIQSNQGRQINIITITEIQQSLRKNGTINIPRQSRISKSLFPYYQIEDRPYKFNKPYVMITSRVHPGQTSASYALEGFINKLIGTSPQSQFLRKTFVFIIIPMINPDGVFHGTYRMDMQGHNLNRFYNNCVAHKQPSIFAIQSLLQYHSEDLVAFFDLHSHPQCKGSFAYGNAYTSIYDQIQSQVFMKLMSYNSQSFTYQNCTFSQKNMNSKDINDILTKDGSARVCAYKKMLSANFINGIHCYALQLGYHGSPLKKQINRSQQIYQFKSNYKRENKQFDLIDYMENGVALSNTLIQIYIQNYRNLLANTSNEASSPTSLVPLQTQNLANQHQNYLLNLRQQVSKQIYDKDQRFRIMDNGLLKKLKNIHNITYNNFYTKILKKYPNIQESINWYENQIKRQNHHRVNRLFPNHQKKLTVVHSLELNRNNRLKSSIDNKKQTIRNQQRMPAKDYKNPIFRSVKQKINITPVQFFIPHSRNNNQDKNQIKGKRQQNFNQILQMQADSLPRINKKKLNFLTERLKLRQKRVESSASTPIYQKIEIPTSRGSLQKRLRMMQNAAFENNMQGIIDYQNYVNIQVNQEEQQLYQKIFEQASQQYKSNNQNPQSNQMMNAVRNEAMFRKQVVSKNDTRKKIQVNYQTQRLRRKLQLNHERNVSYSKQKQVRLQVKVLPKLEGKTQKMRNNKFQLELRMKQKYDKKYKLQDI